MLKKYNFIHYWYHWISSRMQHTNSIAFVCMLLSLFGGYYLIETTLLELHVTSGLGATKLYDGLKRLQHTKDTFRFVSIGYMPTIPLFYGLDTFDGFIHNSAYRRNYFIAYAIYDPAVDKLHTHTHFFFSPDALDFNMFKMANIGYIFSDNPISNHNFTLIEQSNPIYINDIDYPLKNYISSKFKDLRLVNPSYIYSLEGVWPRIFTAKSIKNSSYSLRDKRFYKELKKLSIGELLVAKEDISENTANQISIKPLLITSYTLNEKGAEINLTSQTAGVIVFNQVFTPFWSASCDTGGKKMTVFPVNGIMMATQVPKGCNKVLFEYNKDPVILSQQSN